MNSHRTFMRQKRLIKNDGDKSIAGVCAGLGDYFELPYFVVRLIAVLCLICFTFATFLLYILAAIFMPNR